jgi:hypothetical protein
MKIKKSMILQTVALSVFLMASTTFAVQKHYERVSIRTENTQGIGEWSTGATSAAITADGRFVAFATDFSNFSAGEMVYRDIYVRDRIAGSTKLVSISTTGTRGNNGSYSPSISDNGRFIAFSSASTNFVQGDNNFNNDIFVHDRVDVATKLISVATSGAHGNGYSGEPSINNNGSLVAFESDSSNLIPNDSNGWTDIFVRNWITGTTQLISIAMDGSTGNGKSIYPAVNGNGHIVAFASKASNLVPNDNNGRRDIFVRNWITGRTQLISVAMDGSTGNRSSFEPSINDDGNLVSFGSASSNLVPDDNNDTTDVFVRNTFTGVTELISISSNGIQGDQGSWDSVISPDGRYVVFTSNSTNLIDNSITSGQNLYIRDRIAGVTNLIFSNSGTTVPWLNSASISRNGLYTVFSSIRGLIPSDTNGLDDVYVYYETPTPPPPPFVPRPLPEGVKYLLQQNDE